MIIVDNKKPRLKEQHISKVEKNEMTWNDLLKEGVVEYIDAEEENGSQVALTSDKIVNETTHLEITPIAIMGLAACMVPYAEYNRGDRVNFGAKMSGQALGIYSKNFLIRSETKADVLIYPQKPLVETVVSKDIGLAQGQNLIIALSSFHGFNMEDAIIFNKASLERGMGRSFAFRTYKVEEKRYFGIERDEIKIPDKTVSGYKTEESYANLSEDGIINREIEVKAGNVLVGRVSPLRFFGPTESFMVGVESRRETSEIIRYGEEGIVDNVLITETSAGNKLIKVIVRSQAIPELGDKFASRHGQKGIVGLIIPEEDMPFTEDGIIPDVIINPHAIPSRMTIGQLLEFVTGKAGALIGESVDATPFVNNSSEMELRKSLEKAGFKDDGKEDMYDGRNGRKFQGQILIGPVYLQKLHHMVGNKMHARGRGPVTLLTKQPTAGRSKQGGLRLGEMEKDCLVAHGAALLLKERFSSDRFRLPVCSACGVIAVDDKLKGKIWCPFCNKSSIVYVEMAYAFKLMLDELKCMGIYPKILTEEKKKK